MKILNKVWLLVLVLALLVSVFAACGKKTPEGEVTTAKGEEETAPPDDDDPTAAFAGMDLDTVIRFINWNSEVLEFIEKEEDAKSSRISEAIYSRDLRVCELLNVDIKYKEVAGNVANYAEVFNPTIINAASSGDYYDVIAGYPRACGELATQGILKNLNAIEGGYLNFDGEWWPESLITELTIGTSIYFVSGDITPSLMEKIYCLYYNADLFRANEMTDPYDCVQDDTWTMETFYSYISAIEYSMSGAEASGLLARYFDIGALVHGCGIRLVDNDESDMLSLSDTCFSQKAIDIVDALTAQYSNAHINMDGSAYGSMFNAGSALFIVTETGSGINFSSDNAINFEFSCVPTPKYDSEQENYYSTLRQPVSYFAMMNGIDDTRAKDLSAFLECFAIEGNRVIRPAVVELGMQSQYASGPKMREMIGLIIDSVTFDVGRIYSSASNYFLCDQMGNYIQKKASWSGYKSSYEELLKKAFSDMSQTFMDMEMQA